MLSTAESVLGLSRHLSMYALGPSRAALGNLEFAGQLLELSVRLRGSGVSPAIRVKAIAQSAGIPPPALKMLLATLETLGWVEVARDDSGAFVQLSEKIPPLSELVAAGDKILAVTTPDPVEMAALKILDATTRTPLTLNHAMEIGTAAANEHDAERAIEFLADLNLCRRAPSDEGVEVVYNPNIWSSDTDYSTMALRLEDGPVYKAVSGLVEEVAQSPGMPEEAVTSAPAKWINFAVAQGLIQRSLVRTSDGDERGFLFTPHMSRNAFAEPSGVDPSGHVRQLIGSMIYASRFAKFQLWSPRAFLRAMIRDGEAGDVPNIASDYVMLETAGIVRVEPAQRAYKLVLLQTDVAQGAVEFLTAAEQKEIGSPAALGDQETYRHPEQEIARLGREAPGSSNEQARIVAALREAAARRDFGA